MRYFADTLSIKKFRKIENQTIHLSKKINVFSGQNGVGKSNLMSLIATSFGKSKSRIGRGSFQPEFYDYFTIPSEENYRDYYSYIKVVPDDQTGDFIQKRHGFKDDSVNGRGIRIIPRSTNYYSSNQKIKTVSQKTNEIYSIGDSARIPLPTIFLSLSRLYPVGETELSKKTIRSRNKLFQNGSIKKYIEWYNFVLPGSILEGNKVIILDKSKIESDGIYIAPKSTTESTQSIGQDNLRAIINALVDFHNLKELAPEKYYGGILCIDEVDASLHPSAQLRLLNLLNLLSEELKIQVFLTTHSLTILEKIISWRNMNPKDYNLIYLIDPIEPKIQYIGSYEALKADLLDERIKHRPNVKVYCEDEVAKFLIDEFKNAYRTLYPMEEIIDNYEIVPVYLGANQLTKLPEHDSHFNKVGIILDGDAKTKSQKLLYKYLMHDEKALKGIAKNSSVRENIMYLPTFLAPESYMYYIISETYKRKEFSIFWSDILSIPENMYYTKERVHSNIINKVTVNEDLKNEDIKKGNIKEEMKQFISDTQLISNYYAIRDKEELIGFIKDMNKIIKKISIKTKAN
ncbi:AAA family ATPase [Staphylococcus pseudintermedius]|uniref:AAA family ATPase n=1 Tax=Staphylococcus pseudintermedius TaxID=283734 RepID=UPI0028888557|nr:AAA family ATPase [Staphylococcus pseudintermedius]MDT0777557.1 AAA family ATPase [Staphylococcus pseudintermedius]MDT0959363.1 AAA family ATPase [Staphylococcus pseudintermedius]HAR6172074.1 AAA family ATPase [Staphylococcus pseudintermedius]